MDVSLNQLHSLRELFEQYAQLGFKIVAVTPGAKAPMGKKWQKTATDDVEKLMEIAKENPGCNWGLLPSASGLFVVDVDAKKGGLEYWAELTKDISVDTLTQESGGGGKHFLFKARPGARYGSPLGKHGIDGQFERIIVVHPSTHKSGRQYRWVNEAQIQDLPPKLAAIFEKPENVEELAPPPDLPGLDTYFGKLAKQFKTVPLDYNTWLSIGMSLHSALPNEKGLALWQDISKGPSYKQGDEAQCEYKWKGFSKTKEGGALTYRSLGFIARELGLEVPNLNFEADKLLFATEQQKIELEAEHNPHWFIDDSGKVCTRHKDFLVKELNAKGFFILESATVPINQLVAHKTGHREVVPLTREALKIQTESLFFKEWIYGERKGWHPKYWPASKIWLENQERTTFRKVIFAPYDEPGALNLWAPLPITPIAGDTGLFLELVIEGLADGNYLKAFWLLDWLAHLVQRPQEKSSLVPVLIGDQGTGKGFLFDGIMKAILGHFHYKIMTARTLKERFNAEQAFRFLTFIDEATWRGDKEEDGILKSLTGSKTMTIEAKFGSRIAVNNYSRYAIASNNPEAVSIERSNRRYVVFEVNPTYRERASFFGPLSDSLEKGTLANHVMHYLLARDLSNFNPHVLPKFSDGQGHQAKIASEGVVAQFWADCFYQEPRPLWLETGHLVKPITYLAFQRFMKQINTYERSITQEVFWKRTYSNFGLKKPPERSRETVGNERLECVKIWPSDAANGMQNTLNLETLPQFDASDYVLTQDQKDQIGNRLSFYL